MRDWGTYRKLYDNLPPAFERLLYQARCFAADLLRRCDRAGRIVPGTELTDGLVADVAFHVRAHAGEEDFLRRCLALLLDDGYLAFRDGHLVIRNFVEAQRSESAERMAKKRARDAGLFSESSDHVTSSDARDASDTGDAVTSPSSNLVSSDLISDPDPEQGTRSKPGSPRARARRRRQTCRIFCVPTGFLRLPRSRRSRKNGRSQSPESWPSSRSSGGFGRGKTGHGAEPGKRSAAGRRRSGTA